ncbi:hypothetical protein OIDMADRAFT_144298 [Oidiodendron maius Zn]|uniref:Zinc finger PHD-type domain-containing protein n=1 Tax=Oidiodendron maius (strain Zn) TaxID=913774 RepID=A0A0C3CRK1_OIDMZ|nr:hypothetical protein OIDMADRAFT_144298 [Oidiodendron maius Zn]
MFPPLDICQIPDVWFCPVCVGRNWHMPLGAISTPPTTLPSTSLAPTPLPSGGIQAAKENEPVPPESENPKVISHNPDPQRNDDAENQSKRWREVQRWKENAWLSPRGYILDPSCSERFISLSGEEPISLNTVMKNRSVPSDNDHDRNKSENHSNNQTAIPSNIQDPTQGKIRRTGKGVHKSPPRKRSKYSDLPKDIEKALDLITSRLEEASRSRRWQDDVDGKARAMEQKVKIQEGEVLLCRQELHTVKQQLLNEVTTTERLRAENADLREKLEEARTLAERKENEMKNWQAMLRTVMGSGDGPPLS